MTPRDRYRRCRAYARASQQAHTVFLAAVNGDGGFWNKPMHGLDSQYVRGLALAREAHAWSRLPEAARAAIHIPTVKA